MFDAAHDAVEVTAGDQPTSDTLSLSWTGPHGLPQTFVAPTVQLAAGDQATFTPANWSTLQSSQGHAADACTATAGPRPERSRTGSAQPARYSVALKIAKAGANRRAHDQHPLHPPRAEARAHC